MNILDSRILHVKAAIYTTILSETKEVSTSKEVAPFFTTFTPFSILAWVYYELNTKNTATVKSLFPTTAK